MAKTLGEAGRYVSQAASEKQLKRLTVFVIAMAVTCWLSGFLIGFLFLKKLLWVSLLVNASALAVVLLLRKWAYKQLEDLDKQRADLRKGARGEIAIGLLLANFPDTFCVINDLATRFGNIDHVVIGPTGVFALDTKNWRGTVSADGKGELLLNGRAIENGKTFVKPFVRRVMEVKDRLKGLAQCDFYIQPIFVFTSAFVDANWGRTGSVFCMRDEQVYEFIVENEKPDRLKPEQVRTIARAFAALARMDSDFPEKASETA